MIASLGNMSVPQLPTADASDPFLEHWGFTLRDLYTLALKFFKGMGSMVVFAISSCHGFKIEREKLFDFCNLL